MNELNNKTFRNELINHTGEFITLFIQSGNNNSIQKGIISNVEGDFLIIINDNYRTEISLNSILGFKKKAGNNVTMREGGRMGDYKTQNKEFSREELVFLIKRMKELREDSSLSENEKKILTLLIQQTRDIIDNKKRDNNNKQQNVNLINQQNNRELKNILEIKIGSYVVLSLNTNGKPSEAAGVLSNVYHDFIVLINDLDLYYIKINKIASIKNNLSKESKNSEDKITFKDQYYLEEKRINNDENQSEESNKDNNKDSTTKNISEDNLKINKQQKNYSVSDE